MVGELDHPMDAD